ncbi:MAG: PAS domain-containing sensor histidine kinase [Campylobacterales bacterium]|nr:PAS domain-containing sensor histidine kinase [Campylobacterales bacterium]
MDIENFRTILDTLDNGVLILDENYTISFCNKWLEYKTKYTQHQIINQNIFELFPDINKKLLIRKIKSSLSLNTPTFYTVNPHNFLIKIKLNNITEKIFEYMQQSVTIVPFDLEKKQVCIYIYDNTQLSTINFKLTMALTELEDYKQYLEQKVDLEIRLNQQKDKLLTEQSKLAAMGEMVGAIAHQWRQPLNAISASIQFLEDDYQSKSIDVEYITKFIEENMGFINFMSSTIDDFRNFFRIDKEKTPFSIKNKILETIKIARSGLKQNKIQITINDEDFTVLGYPSEFQQVILNLLNNSKDAIIENKIENPQIIIQIYKYGLVEVYDNAGGINDQIMDRIFEPYFTTKEQSKGIGIGLYMAKKIIEDNMSGKITAHNYNDGVVFKIDLSSLKGSAYE